MSSGFRNKLAFKFLNFFFFLSYHIHNFYRRMMDKSSLLLEITCASLKFIQQKFHEIEIRDIIILLIYVYSCELFFFLFCRHHIMHVYFIHNNMLNEYIGYRHSNVTNHLDKYNNKNTNNTNQTFLFFCHFYIL